MPNSVLVVPKSIFASKTLWVNILTIAADLLGHATGVIDPAYQPYIVSVLAIVNIVLRNLTKQPIG